MFVLIISLLLSAASVAACNLSETMRGWSTIIGIVVFLLAMYLIGRIVGKRVAVVQTALQEHMQKGQARISRDIHQFQMKPHGNPKAMQMQVEQKQQKLIKEALEMVEGFAPFQNWSLLMGRQMNTMKLQFHYQLKEYDKVDALLAKKGLLSKPMLMEPLAVSMKMARQYETGDMKALEKTFKKRIRWMRGDRGTLLYALMSWAYVKKGQVDEARLLLAKGMEKTGNEVLARNWELLANDKVKSFSNKGLGEEWYAIGLEAPPTPKAQRQRGNAKGQRRF